MPDVTKTVELIKDPTGQPAHDPASFTGEDQKLGEYIRAFQDALEEQGLGGFRAQVAVCLDHSDSMRGAYEAGSVQALAELELAFALTIDHDGKVPTRAFDNQLYDPIIVTAQNYSDVVNTQLWRPQEMGSTIMSGPLEWLIELADKSDVPVFGIVDGDGSPNARNRQATMDAAYRSAGYPLFLKFITLDTIDLLTELDNAGEDVRLLDNIAADTITPEQLVPGPNQITPFAFARAMVRGLPEWIEAATTKHVLT